MPVASNQFLALSLAVATAGGCTAAAREETPERVQSHSLVQLELSYTRELVSVSPTRLEAAAHFVRYRTADRAVDARAVAGLLGLPGDRDADLLVDSCTLDESGAPAQSSALQVSLLDAGPLTLRRTDGARTPLFVVKPQHYPEIMPFVSGVMYAFETRQELLPGSSIEMEAEGGEDVGPFVVAAKLPTAFPDLTVATLAHDLEVRWSANNGAPVSIELRWAGAHPGAVRCKAADDGVFLLPRAVANAKDGGLDRALAGGDTAQVSISRSERSPLDAPGAGAGQLLVTLRDVTSLLAP